MITSDDQFIDLESGNDATKQLEDHHDEIVENLQDNLMNEEENNIMVDSNQIDTIMLVDNTLQHHPSDNNTENTIVPVATQNSNTIPTTDVIVDSPNKTIEETSTVAIIPAVHTLHDSNDGILSGFHVKYTWNNIPGEVLVEMFLCLDQKTLSEASLVSRDWYESSKHDLLWYKNCVGLFERIYGEQSTYYVSERTRIGYMKKYGHPIPPPPKPPKVEDYVTFDNENKIISVGTLRGLHIKQGKKQDKERRRIEKEKKTREFMAKYHEKLRNNTRRFIIGASSVLYFSFLLFFIMTGITDAVDQLIYNAIGVRWQVFSFIPLWFVFAICFIACLFFIALDCLKEKEFREGFWIAALLLMGGVASFLIVAILALVNVLLPFTENPVHAGMASRTYTYSWFYVLIIPYLYILVICFAAPIATCFISAGVIKENRSKTPITLWYGFGINFLVFLLESFVIMLGFGLEFTTNSFYLMYAAIPLELFFIIMFFVLLHYFLKAWRENSWAFPHDGEIYIWFLIFIVLLFINCTVVSFSPYLGHYAWFASLVPLTHAYAFAIRMCTK